jgi:purine-nucleoside phosphorylase
MSEDLAEQLEETARHLRARVTLTPRVLIAADRDMVASVRGAVEAAEAVAYALVPGFPAWQAKDGGAAVTLGHWGTMPVGVVPGSAGAPGTLRRATLPVRALRCLGADVLVGVGRCVATEDVWAAGEVMLIDDHINLLGDNPLVGPNDETLGTRFPDMSEAYDRALAEMAVDAARGAGVSLRRGVYAAVRGGEEPTPAERHMLRTLGADAVGGGMVPEVIVARHMGMRVLGLCATEPAANMIRILAHLMARLD